jgi:hypothetical protein
MKPDPFRWGRAFLFVGSRRRNLTTRRRRTQQHWTRNVSVTPHIAKSLPAKQPKIAEPPRDDRDSVHLGPYESCYDVALGYGFERSIVRP